jgi:hypothetical protein
MFHAETLPPVPPPGEHDDEARWGVRLEADGPLHAVDRAYARNVGRRLRQLGRFPATAAELRLTWVDGRALPAHVSVVLMRNSSQLVATASGRTYREALDRLEAGVRRELADDRHAVAGH